jgi:hypothetical protein
MQQHRLAALSSAVIAGLLFASPAMAELKTAKECDAEWKANKAAIQASGKTKKVYVAECRTQTAGAAPATAPAAAPEPAKSAKNTKTAKECDEEWKANKAAIQASHKTKKDYVAECRTQTAGAPPVVAPAAAPTATTTTAPSTTTTPWFGHKPTTTTAAAPAGGGQYQAEAQAKAHCPGDTVVWVNLDSKIYHFSGHKDYGNTKQGAYMCERETAAEGYRAAKNEKHP